ncbi:MAG: lysophospholipid acyltransferase family protein [Shimia sp.]
MRQVIDATLGRALRILVYAIVRTFLGLKFNIGCSGKHLLENRNGTLILATHVSWWDGPLAVIALYPSQWIRVTVRWAEFHHWLQHPLFILIGAIPMSTPKDWAPERRAEQKRKSLDVVRRVMDNGHSVLLFPSGLIRAGEEEVIAPHLSGAYDILRARPDTPVLLMQIDGVGKHQWRKYDGFWNLIGRARGRQHVDIKLREITLDPTHPLEAFNARLEAEMNAPG